jgi:hypothetical protein
LYDTFDEGLIEFAVNYKKYLNESYNLKEKFVKKLKNDFY